MGNLVGIDEVRVHAPGNIARRNAVEAMGVNERVTLYHLHTIHEGGCAELLVVIVLWGVDKEVSAHDAVHQYRDTAMLTRFAHELGQVVVERRTRVGMAVSLGFLVVVPELDDDIVAGFHLL